MAIKPYLILQFAKYLDKKLTEQGKKNYELRVEANARLNYRIYQPLIDPNVDISKQTFSDFRHNDWILQLDPSLKPKPVRRAN